MESADVFLGLHDFLERMRQPSAADFVKAIKSFIVSFSNNAPDPERDSAAVQQFLANMEAAFRAHPLWAGCSEEELESAGEFIRPENLDVKSNFQNETSWLLAQKELQKINMYKAPRDKLVCILNCCKVINNLLINASIASNANPPGADEFLPVLIYVTIKANPPQLHSNLLYIQRFRRQSRLVAEAAYFFTNMLSAESFIRNIDAKAVSMDEAEFERNMESARAVLSGLSTDLQDQPRLPFQNSGDHSRTEPFKESASQTKPSESKSENKKVTFEDQLPLTKIPSLSDLENKGASMLLKEDGVNEVFREYPYLFARAGDLTVSDVEDLLNSYKQLVIKYVCLSKGLGVSPTSHPPSDTQNNVQNLVETKIDSSDSGPVDADEKTEKSPDRTEDTSEGVSLSREKNLECDLPPQDEAAAPQAGGSLESSN
ncbi:vacuolar protein sorting-associated protein 9A-like isoform X2 [Prosopis cineraria]|uniref:vacuolar protein sorting-associated protein 9A-like isoform X2 n=1 Tax=Prosopis cineraria TaxID=364024 RepID=UPI00240EE58C|nr:vacuolar protein sorting-associated protein 9A-like isoform X2 [Prosopis cineraria]